MIYCLDKGVHPTDGHDILLAIWASYNGRVGHAGVAVTNYAKDGSPRLTYTYYDKWPAVPVNKDSATKDVPALHNKLTVTLNTLTYTDVTGLEGRPPNGVIRIKTDAETDKKVKDTLDAVTSTDRPYYNGMYANCADFANIGISVATGTSGGKEMVGELAVTTPNALFNYVVGLPNVVVEYDPGSTVDNSFLEAIGNDPVKETVVEKSAPQGE